jgi:3-hydroxyacyl-[acyl-carrier-protein] dehydratase
MTYLITGKFKKTTIREIAKDTWEGTFHFDPDDGIYRDHFPGYPVVPGSLIVHAFLKALEEAGIPGDAVTIENFKFREFLRPGHHSFRIELREDRLHCFILHGDKKMITGVLKR